MRRIQRFYVGTCLRSPVIDNGDVVAAAAGLVAEFPGENGVGVFVAGDDVLDVVAVGLLGCGVGIEGCGCAAEGICVGAYAGGVVPVVEEGEDELNAVFFCGGDGGVEAGDTCCSLRIPSKGLGI